MDEEIRNPTNGLLSTAYATEEEEYVECEILRALEAQPAAAAALRIDSMPPHHMISFQDLLNQATALSKVLLGLPEVLEAPIGLCFQASTANYIVATVAAMILRLPWVPLDANLPTSRLAEYVTEARCLVRVHEQSSTAATLALSSASPGLALVLVDKEMPTISSGSSGGRLHSKPRTHAAHWRQALYIMFTSGSTGNSKAVLADPQGLASRCEWQRRTYPWQAGEVCIARTAVGFVDHIAEVFAPLTNGIQVVVPHSVTPLLWQDPGALLASIDAHQVTRLVLVPSLLREMLRLGPLRDTAPGLTILHCSGEPLPQFVAENALNGADSTLTLLNLYGSTEVSADVTCFAMTPLDLTEVSLTNEAMQVGAAIGVTTQVLLLERDGEGQTWREAESGEIRGRTALGAGLLEYGRRGG